MRLHQKTITDGRALLSTAALTVSLWETFLYKLQLSGNQIFTHTVPAAVGTKPLNLAVLMLCSTIESTQEHDMINRNGIIL